ncbi:MAG: hypothetical protein GXO26_00105 [Crenarchaeota archaeon]|nr:hypothetical protein [Thermoproteota archaeon]
MDKYFRSGFMIRRVLEIPTPVEENIAEGLRELFTHLKIDQLEEVIRGLEKNPYERCYLICFWDPFLDTAILRAQPCFNLVQFMINPESNTLEVACYMRSHDFAQAHLANYYGLSAIARYVEYRLRKDVPDRFNDLELGELLWVIYSCHIYL